MSFSPSTRGETECTSASKASAVGGSSVGVPIAVSSAASAVGPGVVGRPGGTTPLHPSSRTTVQRLNGNHTPSSSSSPPSPVPRGAGPGVVSSSSPSRGVAAVPNMEPAVAAATPPRPTSPAPTSLPPLPASASSSSSSPHRPPISTETVQLPLLAPATSARAASLSDGRTVAHYHPSPLVLLPALTPSLMTSSAAGEEEERRQGAAPESQQTESPSCVPSSSAVLTPTPPRRGSIDTGRPYPLPLPLPPAPTGVDVSTSPSRPASGPYFRENNVPRLFNELSEALLEVRPQNPVAFMAEWLRQRRDALM